MSVEPDLFTLLRQFHTTEMPRDGWTHKAHMRVAAALIWFHGRDAGLVAIRDGIKKLNASRGTPAHLYNETVTCAWTTVLHSALSELPLELPADEAVKIVVDRFMRERVGLGRYYDTPTLESRTAHDSWVEPTLAKLPEPRVRRFEVRMAHIDEGNAAADVVHQVYDEYGFTWEAEGYHRDLYFLREAYLAQGGAFFVAVECATKDLVGTVGLLRFAAIRDGESVHLLDDVIRVAGADCSLERLYVRPRARQFGLGGVLMRRAIDFAKMCGSTRLEIWSDKRFVQAHRLYEKFGASVVGERVCDDPDQSPEWGLKLQLA